MQRRTCGKCGQKFSQDRVKYVKKELSPTRYLCYECFGDFTKKDHRLVNDAVKTTVEKFLKQSGKGEECSIEEYERLSDGDGKLETIEYIDYFYCMMLVYQGANAVKRFAENYTYNPRQKKQPVYAEN